MWVMNKVNLVKTLIDCYNGCKCELNFASNYQLLVAVILSAQCTDKRVNMVTEQLFKVAPTPEKMIELGEENLKNIIKPCGFFNNKAENIIKATKSLLDNYGGVVPNNKEDLIKLGGVGEKTASVVMAVGFGIPAIAVDTHVFRLSKRLGLADERTPSLTMKKLEQILPKELWIDAHQSMVLHGRYVCKAQRPDCKNCKINYLCPKNI